MCYMLPAYLYHCYLKEVVNVICNVPLCVLQSVNRYSTDCNNLHLRCNIHHYSKVYPGWVIMGDGG